MTDTNTAQMVADLQATDDAVRANGWVAPGLGMPGASLGLLGSTLNPLSGLATAGLGWFMPLVSFLGDGLTQLQGGNGASVTSGSQDFGSAGQNLSGVAGSYRDASAAQTSNWSGEAASQYRDTGAQYADGIEGLGQGSATTGSAIMGAGQVVAQAIAEVTQLIAEAVAEIVPIMTQAMARAGETFGQSVVEAIPPCVGIAVTYAARIAAKLAALLASGDNLMKLVQGGMAVMDLLQQALQGMSQQSIQADAQSAAAGPAQGGGPASGAGAVDPASTMPAGGPPATGSSSAPTSSGGGGSDIPPAAGGSAAPRGTNPWTPPTSSSSAAVPPAPGAVSDVSRPSSQLGGSGLSSAVPGALSVGAGDHTRSPGARVGVGRGGETGGQAGAQPSARTSGSGGGMPGAVPMGAMGGGLGAGETDKEHRRKYELTEVHDEELVVSPSVITEGETKD
jgi:hypothetical protein